MKIKYTILILASLLSKINSLAQPSGYKDFIKVINTVPDDKLYETLFEYQEMAPQFANIYAQLGYVSKKLTKSTDVLRQFKKAMGFARIGKVYTKNFEHFMSKNEARSHKNLYWNIPVKDDNSNLSNEDLIQFSKELVKYFDNFEDTVPRIYKAFHRSKKNYDLCTKIYKELNTSYHSLNEILLKSDNQVLGEIEKLKIHFDSSIHYLNQYQDLIKAYPVNKYNQKYSLKTIKTFRLDGLSYSNFLDDEFEIWNYGKWVEEFKEIYETEIISIRKEIEDLNNNFNNNEKKLKNLLYSDNIKVDDKFLFRVGKFDNNAIIRDYFLYRKGRNTLFKKIYNPVSAGRDKDLSLLPRKVRFYKEIIDDKKIANGLLKSFENAITEEKILRFKEFFSSNFGGYSKMGEFCRNEKENLDRGLSEAFENLREYIIYREKEQNNPKFIHYKNDSIPVYRSGFDDNLKFNTKNVFWESGKPNYIVGCEIAYKRATPFVLKMASETEIQWYKSIPSVKASITGEDLPVEMATSIYKSGSVLLLGSKGKEITNKFVSFNREGKQLSSKTVPVNSLPVFIDFDDINQTAITAFKGGVSNESSKLEPVTICKTDSVGNILWQSEFSLEGNIIKILKTEGNYQVFANYKHCLTKNNKEYRNHKWGLLVINISDNGVIKDIKPLNKDYSFYITEVTKLSSQAISAIGFKTSPDKKGGRLFYSIIHPSGRINYCN